MKYGPFVLIGAPLLAYLYTAFQWGGRGDVDIFLPTILLFLAFPILSCIAHIWYRRYTRSLLLPWLVCPIFLLVLGITTVPSLGALRRPALFAQARPELDQAVAFYKTQKPQHKQRSLTFLQTFTQIPQTAEAQGEVGHRQLVFVVGGDFTSFHAYIWCEDGKPPTEALRYRIDSSDHITPRGDDWFEAVVSNGH